MNTAVVAVHAAQRSANMAMQGAYEGSRLNNFMYKRLLRRRMQRCYTISFNSDIKLGILTLVQHKCFNAGVAF